VTAQGRGRRVESGDRVDLGAEAARLHGQGLPIRTVATRIGRSYGFTHRLLSDSGVELRPRSYRAPKGAAG
jgi:hypothetical protein